LSFAALTGAATGMDERLLFRPQLSFGDEIFVWRQRPLMAGSTYRKLLLDSGQWKIQSLANVSLLA